MYKEFVKRDSDMQEYLRGKLANPDDLEIPVQSGDITSTIRFVKTHLDDLKIVLEAGDTDKD
jgi:hypothetical protein